MFVILLITERPGLAVNHKDLDRLTCRAINKYFARHIGNSSRSVSVVQMRTESDLKLM